MIKKITEIISEKKYFARGLIDMGNYFELQNLPHEYKKRDKILHIFDRANIHDRVS